MEGRGGTDRPVTPAPSPPLALPMASSALLAAQVHQAAPSPEQATLCICLCTLYVTVYVALCGSFCVHLALGTGKGGREVDGLTETNRGQGTADRTSGDGRGTDEQGTGNGRMGRTETDRDGRAETDGTDKAATRTQIVCTCCTCCTCCSCCSCSCPCSFPSVFGFFGLCRGLCGRFGWEVRVGE